MELRSVADYLDNFLHRAADCAYIQRQGYRTIRWSYGQVAELAFRFAQELEIRKISKGDRVAIWAPNSAEWVAAFLGCALCGVVVVPMDDSASPDFAVKVFQQVSAKLVICSQQHLHEATPTIDIGDLPHQLAAHSAEPFRAAAVETTDPLQIVFTSGTTADPKGVVITHGNVLANVAPLEDEIRKYLRYERFVHPVRFLNLLPLSHVFGQFLGIFLPQLMGGVVVFQQSVNPAEVIESIRRESVSVLVAVPRMLQSLKEKVERDLEGEGKLAEFQNQLRAAAGGHFLHRWWIFRHIHRRFGWKFWAFISGGAALDASTEEFWGRLGYAVIQGYGLTETTSLVSVNHPFRLGKGSIGKILQGREVKLAADGEILVRGGGVAAGYWQGNSSQPVAGDEGWYRTGDVGELDAHGNLYFKGRKKEVIVTPAGMNVYPQDLEAALRQQPEVKDCVVVSLPQNGNAEACAVLILREQDASAEQVVAQANQSLAEYQRMRHWLLWPDQDFPRTSTQKPKRDVIAQTVLSHSKHRDTQTARNPLENIIAQITGKRPSHLSTSSDLESDLNLSSLDRVELLSALEDRYQVDLSEAGFSSVKTVGDLAAILHGKPATRAVYHYPRWVQRWPVTWIRFIGNYFLLRPAVFLLGWPHIVGREELRKVRGPALVICNHIGDIDVGFVIAALPHHLGNKLATATGGEALEALRTPPLQRNLFLRIYDRVKWILGVSLLNLFPLPRQAGFRHSFAYAGECIDRGYSVLVFPEGHHTTDGRLRPFQSGIGLLAHNLRVPIVPVRIDGLFELKQAGKKIARPGKIHVTLGAPIQFSPGRDPNEIARELQQLVENLGTQEYR